MPLLNAPLALRDRYGKVLLTDTEAFCWNLVRKRALKLPWWREEVLVSHLIIECWRLSQRYEPGGIAFTTWASHTLSHRITDWLRSREGLGRKKWAFSDRVYEREQPDVVSLDVKEHSRLVEIESARNGDHAPDRDTALAGILDVGGSERSRDYECLGLEPPPRAS